LFNPGKHILPFLPDFVDDSVTLIVRKVEAKKVADLLGAAGLISPVLPVQAVRFSGVAPLSEAHLPAVLITLVVALEVLRAAV
jgi:hypothetical protein